jgi:hypothetical protein
MTMYPFTTVTNIRSYLAYKFHSMQTRARLESLLGKITGRENLLQTFPSSINSKSPNRKLLPVQDIALEKIVGTLNRRDDFDYKFRPLKKFICERWVNTYLTHEREGWQPILVHKIGSEYFVEDGHHRLSVAHELGLKFIQARIWEYSVVEVIKINTCRQTKGAKAGSTKLYIPG